MANTPAAAQAGISPNTAAGVVDLYRENVVEASGTYSASNTSDNYRYNSSVNGVPTSTGHVLANPPYSTQRTDDSWQIAIRANYRAS